MKTIIAGSRNICYDHSTKTYDVGRLDELVERAVRESGIAVTEVVSGCARGPDRAGERWARSHGVPVRTFRPDWKHGGAGKQRNSDMARYADAGIILWDGISGGTADMVEKLRRAGKPYYVLTVHDEPN